MRASSLIAAVALGICLWSPAYHCWAQDVTPPQLQAVVAESATTIRLTFNEPVAVSAGNPARYIINPGGVVPAAAVRDAAQAAQVVLTVSVALQPNVAYTLLFNAVTDAAGNSTSGAFGFSYIPLGAAVYGDVVLNEVMATPAPVVGLPDAEYVELFNRSSKTFSLAGWHLADAAGTNAALPAALLQPGQYVILCANSRVPLLNAFGNVLGLSVPFNFLNDAADSLALTDAQGRLVHTFAYTRATYQDSLKSRGGYSLEMSDPNNTCPGADNYRAAENAAGGTPGEPNSILNKYRDLVPPVLAAAIVQNPTSIQLRWSEPLDRPTAETVTNYALQPGNVQPALALLDATNPRNVLLLLAASQPATVTASNVADCPGNFQRQPQTQSIIAARTPVPGNIAINEILFDPRPGGQRYVELANTTADYLILTGLQLARGLDSAQSRTSITTADLLLPPGGFIAVTRDSNNVKAAFRPVPSARLLQTARNLPAYDATTDGVWLLAPNGMVLDRVTYNKSWHNPDLATTEGVALERLSVLASTQNPANWSSASQAVNLGTPGYANSQNAARANGTNAMWLQPETFAPDAAPLQIGYHFAQAATTLSIDVFDITGRRVRHLLPKTLVGTNVGTFTWDGTDDGTRRLPIGVYVLMATAQFAAGGSRVFRLPCVLAAKL
jgi:hypothetical protein